MNSLLERIFRASRRYRRFARERTVFKSKLDLADKPWENADALLNQADERIKVRDLDGAWALLLEAERTEIARLSPQELKNRERIFRSEMDKVDSRWRRDAIKHLMDDFDDPDTLASRLGAAQGLLDDYYQNQYYKHGLVLAHMRGLIAIAITALMTLLVLIGQISPDLLRSDDWDWKLLLVVLLFGVLGACFSATIKVQGDTAKSKIPEMTAGFSITLARTVLGATPALAAYAFLKAKVLTIGSGESSTIPAALAVAFAAGFSERLVLRLLKLLDDKAGE
jgi:hypothetical protein